MLMILIFLVGSVTVIFVLLLVIVVIGIRQEPPMEELRASAESHDRVRSSLARRLRPQAATQAERTRTQTLGEVKKLLQAYTVEQVAEMLHIGRDKVYYLLRSLLPAQDRPAPQRQDRQAAPYY
jgi:hypothetical protein